MLYTDSSYIKVKVLVPDPFLEQAIDAVLQYKFKDTCLVEETYYDINNIFEDSLKQRICIDIGLGTKSFTDVNNIAGIIEKNGRIFILYKPTASVASSTTNHKTDLMVVEYKYDFIFDGPLWIYIL